jgi:hypothetical protein
VVAGVIAVLMTTSGLLIDILGCRCGYPILPPLLGVSQPPLHTEAAMIPYYCMNSAVVIVRFVFNLLGSLVVAGAGFCMILNGRNR